MEKRTILHCDLNNFYASVACLKEPEIRDKAVAVCGSAEERHGIVLAKNMLAKSYGVQTGETIWQARIKCPGLIIRTPDFKSYKKYSEQVRAIYSRYTDRIESFGIDECWLDVSGSDVLFGNGEKIANKLRETVKTEVGLTISVGVSFNKIFAKLGSDMKKPDAVTVIPKSNFKEIIWPLNIEEMIGIGRATKKRMNLMGIFTLGDLAVADREMLKKRIGKNGIVLSEFANGEDSAAISLQNHRPKPKSIGRSITCPRDLKTYNDVKSVMLRLSDEVCSELREHNMQAGAVQIHLRDCNLEIQEMQSVLDHPTAAMNEFCDDGMKIFERYEFKNPLRSIGIRAINLEPSDKSLQFCLFYDNLRYEKMLTLEKSIDSVRKRFGTSSVVRASLLYGKTADFNFPEFKGDTFKQMGPVFGRK